jgi:hypothetical protein
VCQARIDQLIDVGTPAQSVSAPGQSKRPFRACNRRSAARCLHLLPLRRLPPPTTGIRGGMVALGCRARLLPGRRTQSAFGHARLGLVLLYVDLSHTCKLPIAIPNLHSAAEGALNEATPMFADLELAVRNSFYFPHRRPPQAKILATIGVTGTLGDLVQMDANQLTDAMRGSDVIVFTAGAGGSECDATHRRRMGSPSRSPPAR